jgi:hypothetical protein
MPVQVLRTPMSLPERLQELTNRMLRKKLFLVTMTTDVAPDRLMPHLADHLEYMTELARRGVLFASGPLVSADVDDQTSKTS